MKNLRASGLYIAADVAVGVNEYGSDVSVSLKLSRKDPEVMEALKPLEELLATRANGFLVTAAIDKQVQAGIREKVKDATVKEKERLAKKKEAEVAAATKESERRASQAEQDVRYQADRARRATEESERIRENLAAERDRSRALAQELDQLREDLAKQQETA